MIQKLISKIKSEGISGLLQSIDNKIHPQKLDHYKDYLPFFDEKRGLEIGGLSSIFMKDNLCPVYAVAKSIDNCNFESQTVWEGSLKSGKNFKYSPERDSGYQHISEAYDLKFASEEAYDFLISSHMIEHTANPLKVLFEWKRVLKLNGMMLILIPHKDGTFDRHRPTTEIDHIVEDFDRKIDESDMTHLDEILKLHDFASDSLAGSIEDFANRCKNNPENRCMHHHVFDTKLAIELVDLAGFQIRSISTKKVNHIIVFAQKLDSYDNACFIDKNSDHFKTSIFSSDRY